MARTVKPPSPNETKGRTFERVCDQIRAEMASGRLQPGDKLPPEREMALQFQVGRNAVREALRTLEMAGVVRLEKGRGGGAYILPGDARRVTVAMGDLLNFGSIGLDEITESRSILLDVITRLACERLTSADLEVLEANVDETEAATLAGQLERRAELIGQFYAYLAGISGNRVLVVMATSLSEIVRRFLENAALRGRPMDSLIPSRRRFLVHLRARDAENACAELRQHLITIHKVIQQAMQRASGFSLAAERVVAPAAPVRSKRARSTAA